MIRTLTTPRLLLRVEGGGLLALGLVAYWKLGGNWLLFALLLLTPDIGMLGYLREPRLGAAIYNLVHLDLFPAVLAIAGILTGDKAMLVLALVWFSHINMDRLAGYGLKLATGFKHTHLDLRGPNEMPAEPLSETAIHA